MAVIAWGPMLETGHAVIDGQHRRLVDLVNELHDAMRARATADVIGGVIKELTRYTEYHFSTEEKLMASYGYSATTEHVAEHQAFVEKVGEFARKYDEATSRSPSRSSTPCARG